jgi:hypothetical protein
MSYTFENVSLWKSSLGRQEHDQFGDSRDRLRTQFLSFRKNVALLVGRISAQLPDLTLHDVTHLDALWEMADLIAGDNYRLNPLEAFVLGGAILLHDAATCFEAYDGGVDAVRKTEAWKDAFAFEQKRGMYTSEQELNSVADFAALRQLHASQAERLAEREWKDPDTQSSMYLIEDQAIRMHLGRTIGQIAASHHWNIEEVGSKLRNQVNAPADFTREWKIDPVKVACLLRCADALHIDSRRAPDFLYALLRQQGKSQQHWQAQRWLSQADVDSSDPTSILITSTRPFPETHSKAWWAAFDFVCLAHQELQASNALLKSRNLDSAPPFRMQRITGTESAERMAQHIEADGWEPCSAKIHVSNIQHLVSTIGGKQLYGEEDSLQVAMRELIQNARDAICARQALDANHKGVIRVEIYKENGDDYLVVEDDGVGMSSRVLTGPFLDFGTSFWASTLARQEFPGLLSSSYKSVGKFGIGFYSVFMVADSVTVTTRRYDEGLDHARQLDFCDGLILRPLLRKGRFQDLRSQISTRIVLKLKPNSLAESNNVEIRRNTVGYKPFNVPFEDYLASMVSGLDVKVVFVNSENEGTTVHVKHDSPEFNAENWLKKISFCNYQDDPNVEKYISSNIQRLRPVIDGKGVRQGFAAISTLGRQPTFLSSATIGGLALGVSNRSVGATKVARMLAGR